MMKHLFLFEFVDQRWFPEAFRNMITQITQFNLDFFKIYDPIITKLDQLLKTTNQSQIIDLCSGSSGPWLRLVQKIKTPVKVVLSDKFPNPKKWRQVNHYSGDKIGYCENPVDALAIPAEMKGVRTVFTAFHHFKPDEAKQFLERAVTQGEPIAIFEFTEKNFLSIARAIFLYFFLPIVQTPFIKPRTFARFFWTYIIPIILIMHWWDGLVSNLRTYSVQELQEMVNSIDSQGFQWEIGRELLKTYGMKAHVTYLIGKRPQAAQAVVEAPISHKTAVSGSGSM